MSKDNKTDEWKEDKVDEFDLNQPESEPVDDYGDFEFDDEEGLESYLSDAVAQVSEDEVKPYVDTVADELQDNKKWSIKKKILVGLGTFAGSAVLIVTLIVGWFLFSINHDDNTTLAKSDLTKEELAAQATLPPRDEEQILLDNQIVNILLIGREGIYDGDGNGRSDSMIIASMNTEQKTLKMVSIMRDCYVSIPGYRDNKLNAAFSFGGGPLLCETIERNFGVKLDGYVIVDFGGFKKLIDEIGGVEIELTQDEATYLNTTNYISDKTQRHVVPGKQTVTGVQALGYCRVRKRRAINGENDDYGRTYRQRAVLTQVYEKVKDLSVPEIVTLTNKLLKFVKTDVKSSDILTYAKIIIQMGIPEIEQQRVPIDGSYSAQTLSCGSSLVLNFTKNNAALWSYIYGDEHGDITTITPQNGSSYTNTTTDTNTNTSTNTTTSNDTNTAVITARPQTVTATEAPKPTKNVTKTKAPVVTEEVVVITDEPVKVTEAPVITEAPAPTAAPATEAPAPTVAPVTEAPVQADEGTVG